MSDFKGLDLIVLSGLALIVSGLVFYAGYDTRDRNPPMKCVKWEVSE